FFVPETNKWKLITCLKAPKDGNSLRHLYSFVEDFEGDNGQLYRKGFFGNQWVRKESGEWIELTSAKFSYDATGKAGDRLDYGGGSEASRFYLWNGGYGDGNASYGQIFNRQPTGAKPTIDLYKNEDSLAESIKENTAMTDAIQSGKFDTTGVINGVYYKILKDGSGPYVSVNDSVVVKYKGSLLNGSIFDETKDKPVTFPLKRLIRGWQSAMPMCKVGGKIRMMIPSSMGYSIRNLGIIPPNSILIFEVEVLDIKKPI
ncbi:MAG TPA: DUF3472 domain-containing protein, partial [Ferruginibacter sp.]|nr:DUF3472 domain-containing protein [Ferruginibacter sp.]